MMTIELSSPAHPVGDNSIGDSAEYV